MCSQIICSFSLTFIKLTVRVVCDHFKTKIKEEEPKRDYCVIACAEMIFTSSWSRGKEEKLRQIADDVHIIMIEKKKQTFF